MVKDLSKFVAHHDAEALFKAMRGVGTDDKVLIEIFTTRPRKHIQEIKKAFKASHGKSLEDWIKSECSGNYEKILLDLCEERTELKCRYLHNATAGIGTNEDVLTQILCPATDEELQKLNQTYQRLYKTDLSSLIRSELSGGYRTVILDLLKINRPPEGQVEELKAKADAELLYSAGEGRLGTLERVIIEILTRRPKSHLEQVFRHYEQKTGHTFERALKKEFSGDLLAALLPLAQSEAEYHASLFDQAMRGAGTNDSLLIRLLSTLTKTQIKKANEVYTKTHQRTLASAIKSEISGDYQKVMLGLLPHII